MAGQFHGAPCWFELMTPEIDAARSFYGSVFGWTMADSGAVDFTYLLAKAGDEMVAGLMPPTQPGMPSFWMLYLAVDDVDAEAEAIAADGGAVHKAPADIPGTGRFALVTDPQGAAFGLLQPLPMDPPPESGAFDQKKAGHGNWIELQTTDQKAALDFYAGHFGWTLDHTMPMGEMGDYDIFARNGAQIGGMMPLMGAPTPAWMPYYGAEDVADTVERVKAGGGRILNGPHEVPGPALVVQAADPQGVVFGFVGPKPD